MKPMWCHQEDCSRALAQQSLINGLRQLRDATGGHQVGWKSPTVDDDETASQQHSEEGQTRIEVQCRAELSIQGPPVWNWCAQEHEASENWQECRRCDHRLSLCDFTVNDRLLRQAKSPYYVLCKCIVIKFHRLAETDRWQHRCIISI